jgi:hypothetical protein
MEGRSVFTLAAQAPRQAGVPSDPDGGGAGGSSASSWVTQHTLSSRAPRCPCKRRCGGRPCRCRLMTRPSSTTF